LWDSDPDLRLHERKARLETLLAKALAGIQYNEHVEPYGQTVFQHESVPDSELGTVWGQ
jgi:hypothetical protein